MRAMRRGEWIMTAGGRQFYPFDPRPEEVALEDIAAHLSKLCRFGGAVREFYSVAQHSILVARGAHGQHRDRAREVAALVAPHARLHHLGLTKRGQPRHPLYLPHSIQPEPWARDGVQA